MYVFFHETRNEESLTMMSTVLEEVRWQCSVQTGEEYIFELIIHTKKSEYEQLVDLCPDYWCVLYTDVLLCSKEKFTRWGD